MESSQPGARPAVCLDCRATLPLGSDRCWLCGWKVGDPVTPGKKPATQAASDSNPYSSPAPDNLNRTFSLSTLFLWVTLACVVMGVVRIAPGVGIALAIICLPAGLRTITAVHRRQRRTGQTMTVGEKLTTFCIFLFLAFAITTAIAVAFTVTCFPIGAIGFESKQDGTYFVVAVIVGTLVAGALGFYLFRAMWRGKE